jgi:hypothetical protein
MRCGEAFASRAQIADLAAVLEQLGFNYRMKQENGTWQEICPACKRMALALAQLAVGRQAHGQAG